MLCKNPGPKQQKMAQEEKRGSTKPVVDRIWSISSVNLFVRNSGPNSQKPGPNSQKPGPLGPLFWSHFELKKFIRESLEDL